MSNIEEDIKILKESIKKANTEDADMNDCFETKELEAIENILSEREQDKKRIKELEEENNKKQKYINMASEVVENSILKQKVKDLIKNETINISGFECIPVEDIQALLEEK